MAGGVSTRRVPISGLVQGAAPPPPEKGQDRAGLTRFAAPESAGAAYDSGPGVSRRRSHHRVSPLRGVDQSVYRMAGFGKLLLQHAAPRLSGYRAIRRRNPASVCQTDPPEPQSRVTCPENKLRSIEFSYLIKSRTFPHPRFLGGACHNKVRRDPAGTVRKVSAGFRRLTVPATGSPVSPAPLGAGFRRRSAGIARPG